MKNNYKKGVSYSDVDVALSLLFCANEFEELLYESIWRFKDPSLVRYDRVSIN